MATDFKGFKGTAKRLDEHDYGNLGKLIGTGEDEVRTIVEVEASGSGFDREGRPKILFEPHKFWANLPVAKREMAAKLGLAAPKWGTIPYGKSSEQYGKLEKAILIDEKAALRSASWGASQIMGENHKMIGYDTVQEMVFAFMEDEENHIKGMVDFIIAAGIDDDLRAHNWATFARVYNGPGYKKNDYDKKLKESYQKWAKIPDLDTGLDTVASANGETPTIAPTASALRAKQRKMSKTEVENVQKRLRALGYFEVGKVDGSWGDNSVTAIFKFQLANDVEVNGNWGVYGPITERALFADDAKPAPVSPARASTTVDDLRAQGSTEIKAADATQNTGRTVLGGTLAMGLLGVAKEQGPTGTLEWLNTATSVFNILPWWVWLIAAGAIVWFVLNEQAKRAKAARVEDERIGLTAGRPQAVDINYTTSQVG